MLKLNNTKTAVIKRLQEFRKKMMEKKKVFTFSIGKGNTRDILPEATADLVLIGGGNSYKTVKNDFDKLKKSKIICQI